MFMFLEQSPEDAGIREETIQQIKETAFHLEYISALVKEITGISIPRFDKLIETLLIEWEYHIIWELQKLIVVKSR